MILLKRVELESLAGQYEFEPSSTLASTLVTIVELVVATGSIAAVCVAWYVKSRANGGRVLAVIGIVVDIVVVISTVWAHADKHYRAALEDVFAVNYNEFYCNARTLQVCIEEEKDPAVLLQLIYGDKDNTHTASDKTTIGTSASIDPGIWLHCRALVNPRMTEVEKKKKSSLDIGLVAKSKRAFLEDSTFTKAGDIWCGNMLKLQSNSTKPLVATNSSQQPLHESPFEANT